MIVVPNEGKLYWLKLALKDTVPPGLKFMLRLYTNNPHISRETVRADLTEASYSTYLPREIDRTDWTDPVMSGVNAQSSYTDDWTVWTIPSGSASIQGWFLTDPDDNFILAVEQYTTPWNLQNITPLVQKPTLLLNSMLDPDP